jgi:hypothetical protein
VDRGSSCLDGVTGRRVCFLLWGEPGLRWCWFGAVAVSDWGMGLVGDPEYGVNLAFAGCWFGA